MLIHNKDDIQFVTEFPCLLGHPVSKWHGGSESARGTATVSGGLEFFMQIWRLGGHFSGAHGAFAPPPDNVGHPV